jgi:hypothetical protein
VSRPERDVAVPPNVRAGVRANDVEVFGDLNDATIDFIRVEPRDESQGSVVARITLPLSCILKLKRELGGFE